MALNKTLLCFRSHFSKVEIKRCKTFSVHTKINDVTQIWCTNLFKSFKITFAKIIDPPDRWGIPRGWLNNMICTQVCIGLVTTKGQGQCGQHLISGLPPKHEWLISGGDPNSDHIVSVKTLHSLFVWVFVHRVLLHYSSTGLKTQQIVRDFPSWKYNLTSNEATIVITGIW